MFARLNQKNQLNRLKDNNKMLHHYKQDYTIFSRRLEVHKHILIFKKTF